MAIRITKKSPLALLHMTGKCLECGTEFEYGYTDIKYYEYDPDELMAFNGCYHYVQCPYCGAVIVVLKPSLHKS
jgi:DNA-directed RNA polymerase subunit RPC12/RpoP